MASTLETRFSGQSTVSVPPGHAIAQIGSEWYGAVPDQTGGWTVTDGLSVGDPWGAGVTVLLPNEETRSYDQYIPDPVVNGRRTYWISRTSVSTLPDTTLSALSRTISSVTDAGTNTGGSNNQDQPESTTNLEFMKDVVSIAQIDAIEVNGVRCWDVKLKIQKQSRVYCEDWTVRIPTRWRRVASGLFQARIKAELMNGEYEQQREVLDAVVRGYHGFHTLAAMLDKVAALIVGQIIEIITGSQSWQLRARQQRNRLRGMGPRSAA